MNIIIKSLLFISIICLSSCTNNSNLAEPKKVSLIDYIDKSDLEKYGFSANDIEPPRDCRRPNILREYDNEKTNLYS